jgi:hypothetical protein
MELILQMGTGILLHKKDVGKGMRRVAVHDIDASRGGMVWDCWAVPMECTMFKNTRSISKFDLKMHIDYFKLRGGGILIWHTPKQWKIEKAYFELWALKSSAMQSFSQLGHLT